MHKSQFPFEFGIEHFIETRSAKQKQKKNRGDTFLDIRESKFEKISHSKA